MREIFNRFLRKLNISGRDLAVFLLALLLAFSIWLIHNLSLKYNDYLRVSVVAHCNIEGHSAVSSNRCDVIARCRTTGYDVIKSGLRGRRHVLDVDFAPSVMKQKDDDMFYVTSSDLQEYAHIFYGADVTVDYFVSDTLFFRFPVEVHKKVPVNPVYSISYRSQYINVGDLHVEPDSVIVYGEPFQLETVNAVFTKPVKYNDVSEPVQGVVSLEKIKGVRFSDPEVHFSQDVARYVEMKKTVNVAAVNVPAGKELLILPSSVTVTLRCVFPLLSDPLETLSAEVDFEQFQQSLSGRCPVRLKNLAKGVIGYEIEPLTVGCVLEDSI